MRSNVFIWIHQLRIKDWFKHLGIVLIKLVNYILDSNMTFSQGDSIEEEEIQGLRENSGLLGVICIHLFAFFPATSIFRLWVHVYFNHGSEDRSYSWALNMDFPLSRKWSIYFPAKCLTYQNSTPLEHLSSEITESHLQASWLYWTV